MYASDESYIPEKYLMEYDPDECYGCEDEDDSDEDIKKKERTNIISDKSNGKEISTKFQNPVL